MPLTVPPIPFRAPSSMTARLIAAFAVLFLVAPIEHARIRVQDSFPPRISVYAADDEGFGLVGEVWTTDRIAPIPIPLTSRSATVQRAVPNSKGIQLRIQNMNGGEVEINAVTVRIVSHPSDSQILERDGELIVVGPPVFAFEKGNSQEPEYLSPYLARQDGIGYSVWWLRYRSAFEPPEGYSLITIDTYSEGYWGFDDHGARAGCSRTVCTVADRGSMHGWLCAGIDQQFYAKTKALDVEQCQQFELQSAQHQTALRTGSTDPSTSVDVLSAVRLADDEARLLSFNEFIEINLPAPPVSQRSSTCTLLLTLDVKTVSEFTVTREWPADETEPEKQPDFWTQAWPHHDLNPRTFVHLEGPDLQLDIRPTMGPGLAAGDVNGDGTPDLYLVQGSGREGTLAPPNALYLNYSTRNAFDFVTYSVSVSGTEHRGAGMGALFFDAEGDGDLDLYVANYGTDVLFTNDGTGKFEDATEMAGITGDRWSAGIAAADADLDGDLDLYVTSYLVYDESLMPTDEGFDRYQREDPVAMLPFAFPGDRNVFWRNDSWQAGADGGSTGPLRFTDMTEELGLLDEQGRGMQPVFWDFDRDGDQDLYVANDVSYNTLWRNEGGKSFTNVSFTTGMDDPRGGMGVSIGDADGDGDEDLFLTNWQLEPNALYMNNLITTRSRKSYIATFRDTIVRSKLGRFGVGYTSWGAELFDADLDGDLDLFVANGYTSPDYESTGICVGQPNHFFLNQGEGKFAPAFESKVLKERLPSRAALACDFDRDGDLDLAITANNGPFTLLTNNSDVLTGAHWLGVQLRGAAPNTFGIGAEVSLVRGDRLLRRSMRSGGSYLAGNAPELVFGLADHDEAVVLNIRWPSGGESEHRIEKVDRYVTIEEPK